jgi:site-specific DNA-methyltransferase (adenine-specific)
LYEWILLNNAKDGYKILDTHLGSGSIALACHNLKYELTACELDKEYFEASIKRIENHISQIRMF